MVFGRNMIDPDEASIDAPRDSDAWYLALMMHQFPGSFLPFGYEQVVARRGAALPARLARRAAGSTTSRRSSSGAQRFAEPSLRKTLLKARLVPR